MLIRKAQRRETAGGFTLLELLLTVAIIAILAVILSAGTSSVRERARGVKCMTNLRALGSGFQSYAMDHQGRLPIRSKPVNTAVAQQWHREIWPSFRANADVVDWGVARTQASQDSYKNWAFHCPADRDPASTTPGLSYAANVQLTDVRTAQTNASQILLMELTNRYMANGSLLEHSFIAKRHNGFTHILFADYHIEARTPDSVPTRAERPEAWTVIP